LLSPQDRDALLAATVAALQSGRLADAIGAGERVLVEIPDDLDALYSLGVARLRRGEFDAAVRLLDRVLERAPDAAPVVTERRRAADAVGRRVVAHEVCTEVLARLAPLIAKHIEARNGVEAHIVLASSTIDARALALARRGAIAMGISHPTLWRETFPPIRAGVSMPAAAPFAGEPSHIEPHARAFPHGGLLVFCGVARSPARWWSMSAPTAVAIVVDEFMPCEIVARVRELSGEGARRITLLYANAEIARQSRLPGQVIGNAP
jgi:tetratricopeptide (TPR) repeat protein